MTSLPEYDRPPVVETVLGVQFTQLQLTAAHAGWYWKSYLGDEWPTVAEAPRLDDQFERFGDARVWKPPHSIRLIKPESPRIQITRGDDERMLQVQDSRFVYNWKKKTAEYPTYRRLLPEFQQHLEHFEQFVRDAKLTKELAYNQWEVVYVNVIPKGTLWSTAADWKRIFPGFFSPYDGLETLQAAWGHVIGNDAGRLHVQFSHGKPDPAGEEMIRLQLTARGPVSGGAKQAGILAGLELGHSTIVSSFTNMTSASAQEYWGRRS